MLSIEENYILKDYNTKRYISLGLPQGNRICPLLFNLYLNDIIKEININSNDNNLLLYGDYITLVGYNSEYINNTLNRINIFLKTNFLEINKNKTKYIASSNNNNIEKITINNQAIEKVNEYKYLGINFYNKGLQINKIINSCKKSMFFKTIKLKKILKEKNINKLCIKLTLIKMFVFPHTEFLFHFELGNKNLRDSLEICKRKIIKLMLNLNNNFPSNALNSICLLEGLENKFDRQAKKFINRIENQDKESFINILMDKKRSQKVCKLIYKNKKMVME